MYAFADGETFKVADVPEDMASKRKKMEKRVEKKEEDASKPRKVNKAAIASPRSCPNLLKKRCVATICRHWLSA